MKYLLVSLLLLLGLSSPVNATASNSVDVKEIVLGHMADAYEWHITTFGKTHVSIPLPVIVRSEAIVSVPLASKRLPKKVTITKASISTRRRTVRFMSGFPTVVACVLGI